MKWVKQYLKSIIKEVIIEMLGYKSLTEAEYYSNMFIHKNLYKQIIFSPL